MSSSDIGQSPGFNTQSAGVYSAQPVTGTGPPATVTPSTNYFNSSIGISEQELIALLLMPGYAILPQPTTTSGETDAKTTVASVENTKAQIVNWMWQTFSDGLEQIAKTAKQDAAKHEIEESQRKSEDIKRSYLKQEILKSASNPDSVNSTKSKLQVIFDHTFLQWLNPANGVAVLPNMTTYPSTGFIAGATAVSLDVVRNAVGAVSNETGSQLSVSPIADALQAVGPSSGLPGDYQAATALVAAILYNGSVLRATFDTLQEANASNKPPEDLQFAMNYAKNIIAIVTFNIEQNQPSNNPLEAKQNRLMRLMLSMMAINMVYRLAYGGMTGKEFVALLNGETANLTADVKATLTQLSDLVNSFLPQDPAGRSASIAELAAYIDNKNPVQEMLKTTSLLAAILKSRTSIQQGITGAVTQ